jgi:hypothetical protein
MYHPQETAVALGFMWALYTSTVLLLTALIAWLCVIQINQDSLTWQEYLL